jgi:type III pantothenate kinase
MLLVVDIGNTNITTALVRGGVLGAARRAATRSSRTADEVEILLSGLLGLDGATLAEIRAIACSSVVPPVTAALETIAHRRGCPLVLAGPGILPLAIRVDRPGEVGADRLVNAFAAHRLHGGPLVVVDCGTATTVDAVGPDGEFLGGAIAPGLRVGLDALAERTAKLPPIELRQPERAIGRDTVGALQAGAVFGYQALVSGLLGRVRHELAELTLMDASRIRVVLTGGLSGAPWAQGVGADVIDPDLTLKGLAIMYAAVRGGPALRIQPADRERST